jgi:hypothetical protein
MIDREMALEPEPCGRGGDLSLAVRLDDAARHQRVRARLDGLVQHIIELAQLVAAEAEPVRSSRLTQSRGPPRCAVRRRIGSSGVGRCASPSRGNLASRASRSGAADMSIKGFPRMRGRHAGTQQERKRPFARHGGRSRHAAFPGSLPTRRAGSGARGSNRGNIEPLMRGGPG